MASQDAILSKFEADFKQQQGEMTNKINTVMKAINDRIMGALPSDTVKNPKLNVNYTSPVFFARSYPTQDSKFSSHPLNPINAIKTCSNQASDLQKDQLTVNEIGTSKPKEPAKALEVEFKDLHLNLLVLEVLAHALMYNAILDKYVESLELGKIATANAVIDCRKAKIAVGEGVTRSIFGVKEIDLGEEEVPYWTTLGKRESYTPQPSTDVIGARPPYYAKKDFVDYHLLGEWEIVRDVKLNPFKDVLVFRRMVEFLGVILINLKVIYDEKKL
ncbi:hypothetical protein Tco_0491401 [Tanacetum coccineum]